MVKLSPQEGAQKWAQRLQASLQDIQRGVQRVSVSPTQLAAQKADKWIQELQRAAQEGRWQAALQQIDLETWRTLMIQKGIPRIADGARAALPKVEKIFGDLYNYISRVQAEVERMPDQTLEQRIQRAVEFIRRMAQYKKGAGGGIR